MPPKKNHLTFENNTFLINEDESVLDCLLRNHQAIPYACKAGTCQSCLIKTIDCEATEESKKWIKKTLQAQGYTLACQWIPDTDIKARLPALSESSIEVSIKSLDALNQRVLRVRLNVEEKDLMFHYFPGQYLTLINPAGISRSYSLANNYEDDQFIELHISQTQKGVFTQWLFEQAKVGEKLHIRGPAGDCFYTNKEVEHYPILLAGTGTGLAPLYGVIHEALKQGHKGSITLIHGGRTPNQLYYVDELLALDEEYPQFNYYAAVMEMDNKNAFPHLSQGTIENLVVQHLNNDNIAQIRAFLCGNPALVHSLRKTIFLKGAKSSNIFCDPFIEREVAKK